MPFAPLPDEVLQGLGLAPAQPVIVPQLVAPVDAVPQLEQQPVELPPQLAPHLAVDPALPSVARQPEAPEPNRDFVVPATEFGQPPTPGPAVPPQQPQRQASMTPDAQMGRAQQKQQQADVHGMEAVAEKRDADVALARDELAAHKVFDDRAVEIEKQRKAQVESDAKIHMQKQAFVESTMRAVDDYKVDQNKYMNQMGLGTMAGWGIAMIMSSFGDALQRKQGPNPIVQMLQQRMHDSVVAQMDERDQLKAKNARAQHDLDKYDAFSKGRIEQIMLLDAQNEKRLANMLRGAAAKAKEPMAQATALTEAAKLEQSGAEKASKAAEFAATNDIAKKTLQVSQANLGVSQFNASETKRHNLATEEFTAQQREIEAAKLLKQGKTDEAKLVRERAVGGETKLVPVDPKDVQPGEKTITKDGKTYRAEIGLITDRGGKVWLPGGTESVVADFQKSHEAGLKVLSGLDEMRRLGPEWMSDTANTKKLQEMRAVLGDSLLEMIKYKGLGVPTGRDVELALAGLGTREAGAWKDTLDGMNKARDRIVENMNISMRARGYDKKWDGPEDPLKQPAAEQTSTEKLQTSLKTKPDENKERVWQTTYAQQLKSGGGDIASAKLAADQAMATAGSIAPNQRADLETLKTQAIAGDTTALAAIQDVAKTGGSATIKRMAVEALSEIRTAAKPAAPISSAGPTYDPAGYDPASLVRRFHAPVQPTLPSAPGIASAP